MRFRDLIERPLDELKVDIVLHERGRPLGPIDEIARRDGVGCDPARARPAAPGPDRDRAVRGPPRRSLNRLQALFPIDAEILQSLDPRHQDEIDAFLKRFEQLVLTLQDQVFVGLALREGEDPRELSRRDLAELMERLGAIPSAEEFRNFVGIRNRLAHLYPEEPDRQAANLNAAYEATPRLLEAAAQAVGRAAPRGEK